MRKRDPVLSACSRCRARKTKCSGERPLCKFCHERGLICEWDTPVGLTKIEDLKKKLQDAENASENMRVLMEALQFGSTQVSTLLLAKLRLGVSVMDLAESIRNGTADQYGLTWSVGDERIWNTDYVS